MNEVDLSKLNDDVYEYVKKSDKLQESYKSQWDDPVHSSFQQYVDQIQSCSKDIRDSVENIEKVLIDISQLEECIKRTDDIIVKATNL